jgi:hypothetical protein
MNEYDGQPKYRIRQVDEFWKYHIEKRMWFGLWRKIGGRDSVDSAERFLLNRLKSNRVIQEWHWDKIDNRWICITLDPPAKNS